MTRTTISLHPATLRQVKRISQQEHISLGEAITELLGIGIAKKSVPAQSRNSIKLKSFKMGDPKISLEDKSALYDILDKGDV